MAKIISFPKIKKLKFQGGGKVDPFQFEKRLTELKKLAAPGSIFSVGVKNGPGTTFFSGVSVEKEGGFAVIDRGSYVEQKRIDIGSVKSMNIQ